MVGLPQDVRVRFAPSPTGFMHLGSVRTALMNYLFARQHRGTFILRIEDTDLSRNIEEARKKIFQDMAWLGMTYDEGPGIGGPHEPYLQSQRGAIYTKHLMQLIEKNRAYRCFCTQQELDEKRVLQIAQGKPPRYDRTCAGLSKELIESYLASGRPFIWRFAVNQDQTLIIQDLAHGPISFDMKNFGDFTIARQDGTCTFMFVNFVDDMLMNMTHVIRGQDHLSNTANQAALYDVFNAPMPRFWHLPIICSITGEKMSKRDFGFSLEDLRNAGYLPEAIINYMARVGSSGTGQEVASLDELIRTTNYEHLHPTAGIKYDEAKLTWFNHQWISRLAPEDLFSRALPFLRRTYPTVDQMPKQQLRTLVRLVATDVKRLDQVGQLLAFYFSEPTLRHADLVHHLGSTEKASAILALIKQEASTIEGLQERLSAAAKAQGFGTKELLGTVRYLLTGSLQGLKIGDLLTCLAPELCTKRLTQPIIE